MSCQIDHSPGVPKEVGKLENSQAGFWRHKCAGCAYELGRRHAAEAETRLRERLRAVQAELDELKAAAGTIP